MTVISVTASLPVLLYISRSVCLTIRLEVVLYANIKLLNLRRSPELGAAAVEVVATGTAPLSPSWLSRLHFRAEAEAAPDLSSSRFMVSLARILERPSNDAPCACFVTTILGHVVFTIRIPSLFVSTPAGVGLSKRWQPPCHNVMFIIFTAGHWMFCCRATAG